jgi:hypothetical protein
LNSLIKVNESISTKEFCQGEIREMTGFGIERAGIFCERPKTTQPKTIKRKQEYSIPPKNHPYNSWKF